MGTYLILISLVRHMHLVFFLGLNKQNANFWRVKTHFDFTITIKDSATSPKLWSFGEGWE